MTERERRPLEHDNRVRFKLEPGERLEVSLSFDGEVTLYLKPADTPHTQPEPSVPAAEAARAAQPTRPAAPEKQQRVTLAGIVGTPVGFHTNRRGTLVGSFQLGVPVAGEARKKTWRPVVVFGERAERLRDRLSKGDEVTVIGYPHPRTTAQGRVIDEVYLTAVRHVKPKDTPAGK